MNDRKSHFLDTKGVGTFNTSTEMTSLINLVFRPLAN